MLSLLKEWKFWALIVVAGIFAYDVASHLFNFPIRLVLLRVELFLAEGTWTRLRL